MTEEQLLDRLNEVNEELSSGKIVTSGGSEGVNSSQQQFRNLKKAQHEIRHDLHILDPIKYSKPRRVRKTRAMFR